MSWKDIFPKEKRYLETESGILYCGNCLEILPFFPEEGINLILTDPPYNISKVSNFHTMKDRKNPRTGTFFGEWDTKFNFLLDNTFLCLLSKVLIKGGSLLSFMSFEQFGFFAKLIKNFDMEVKDRLIWRKTNPFPRNRDRRYVPNIELIVWVVKNGDKWIFNRQNPKYEESVLSFPSESGGAFKRYHPTQKPLELIKYLLRIHSDQNDIVLDPFIGSGTLAEACEILGRKWIGIEISSEYCNIIKTRVGKRKRLF